MNINLIHLLRPYWLFMLIPIIFVCWRLWRNYKQNNAWVDVCDPHLLPHLLIGTHKSIHRWLVILFAVSSIIAVIALAGPSWHKVEQPIYQIQAARVIVLDLSSSMYATDIKPSRFIRAKYKIIDLLKEIKEGQTGMIAFTAQAFVVSPLTSDRNTIINLLDALEPGIMPIDGADITKALKKATTLLIQAGFKQGQIILITDSTPDAEAIAEAKRMHRQGFDISVYAIGTTNSAPVSLPDGGFLKDEHGNIILEKLNILKLTELAYAGGGKFNLLSADNSDIKALLSTIDSSSYAHTEKQDSKKQSFSLWQDQGRWLLLLVLFLAIFAFVRIT